MSDRRTLFGSLLTAVFLALTVCAGAPAAAADGVTATATLDGRSLAGVNARTAIRLDPGKVSQVTVELANGTGDPITVRRVDLTGHVMGLNFFSYSTAVEMTVAAGKTEKLTYRLDPAGLDGQATGLIGADLTVIGSDGEPVAEVATIVDVRGSLMSVYGLFGIILTVLTALAIADAALTVARHRLSANRWQRGLRLLAPGIGIGLMIGFTASAARWWVPATGLWLALAGATATLFFLAGYFSPTPDQGDGLDLDAADLAAARDLDAHGYGALAPVGGGSEARDPQSPGWRGGGAVPNPFRSPESRSSGSEAHEGTGRAAAQGFRPPAPGSAGSVPHRFESPGSGSGEPVAGESRSSASGRGDAHDLSRSGSAAAQGFRTRAGGSGGSGRYSSRAAETVAGMGADGSGATERIGYGAPGAGFSESDRGRARTGPGVGGETPFGPAVRGPVAGGAAEPQRPPGPGWHDPSEDPTVRVPPPGAAGGRGAPAWRVTGGSNARGYRTPERDGGTLRDIGGTLPDLSRPDTEADDSSPPTERRPTTAKQPPRTGSDQTEAENAETIGYSRPAAPTSATHPESDARDNSETLGRGLPAADGGGGSEPGVSEHPVGGADR